MKKTKAAKSQVTDFEAQLRSKYGATKVYSVTEESKLTRVYSTGVLSLDLATGIGGFPAGKVIEIFGKESSGKTALMLLAIAAAQQRYNMPSLYVDEEGNTDRGFLEWAHKLGVREDMLTIVQPEYAEEAFSILEDAAVSGKFAYGAVDSLAYMVPKVELEGAYDDQQMGLQARVVRKSLRKVTQKLAKSPMCLAFLNHVTMKIGRVFGDPTSTPGGTAVKHSSSMRIRMGTKLQSEIKDSRGQMCGHVVTAYVVKNKCGPPRGLAEFALNYYAGVDNIVAVIDFAVQYGVLKKRGNNFVMDDGKTSLGNYEEARQYLSENLNVLGEIEDMVRKLDLTRKSL